MISLPRLASIYIGLIIALALSAVSFSIFQIGYDAKSWTIVFFLSIGITLLDLKPIMLFGEKIEITISTIVKFAAVLLFPLPSAILGTFFGTLLGEFPAKRKWFAKLFNIGQLTISVAVSSLIFHAIYQSQTDYFGSFQNGLAVSLAGIGHFLIATILLCMVVSLVTKTPILSVWIQNTQQIIWYELALYPFGVMLAILWSYNPISILLAGIMFLVIRQSYQVAVQLQRQTHDALRALVQVIDVRDRHTFDHSERVSHNAEMIAKEMKLPPEEVEIIASAALLHDLGKVGMVDNVLFSPKRLTPDEQEHAKQHAEVGAMLLSKFPLFARGAELVRHHHERFDGKGYPAGLEGNNIPLGSRIIAVADSYEAMIEKRLYREALTQDEALGELTHESGTQFDPQVVETFIRLVGSNGHV